VSTKPGAGQRGLGELKDQNLIELRDQYETALRHKEAVQELRRATQENLDQIDARASAFSLKAEKTAFEGASPVGQLASTAYASIEVVKSRLSTFVTEQREQLTELLARLDELVPKVDQAFSEFLVEYEERVSALSEDKRRLLESHRRVMEETKSLPQLQLDRDSRKKEIDGLLTELARLSQQVADKLDEQTSLRQRKVEDLNDQISAFGVRLSVEPLARRSEWKDLSL
jgi:hypothetical protein